MPVVWLAVGVRPHFVKARTLLRAAADYADLFRLRLLVLLQHSSPELMASELDFGGIESVVRGPYDPHSSNRLSVMTIEAARVFRDPLASKNWAVVMGDAEVSLAASLAAAQEGLRVCHVEAGVRSLGTREGLIAQAIDYIADLRCATTAASEQNLIADADKLDVTVGDLYEEEIAIAIEAGALPMFRAEGSSTAIVAIHHDRPTAKYEKLVSMICQRLSERGYSPIVVTHPKYQLATIDADAVILPAVDHLTVLRMVSNAAFVVTDSGGLQREAYYLGRRCLLVQDQAWWPELVMNGSNVLIGAKADALIQGIVTLETMDVEPRRMDLGSPARRTFDALVSCF